MPPPRLLAATAVGTLAYLGLAIAGEGGVGAFFANQARTVAAAVLVALMVSSVFTVASLSAGEREDRSNRWVVIAIGVLGLLLGYLPAYTDRAGFLVFSGEGVRWAGVVLFAVGGALRIGPVFVLGRRFSGLVAIQKDHALVTTGLYGAIRHPSYLGLVVNAVGWALVFRSGVGLVLTALTLIPLVARMNSEEALLASQFGEAYDAYRARTARLIPGLY